MPEHDDCPIKPLDKQSKVASRARGASRVDASVSLEGAPPSNRAPSVPIASPLRYGVDSLFLSYSGSLYDHVEKELERLKKIAQSDDPLVAAEAQFEVGDHFFEVQDKGAKGFPYFIKDNAFLIKISRGKSTLPVVSAQISSDYLAHVGVVDATNELNEVIKYIALIGDEKISRADLFVDVATDYDFGHLRSNDFITKCEDFAYYEKKPNFTGLSAGLGGDIAFRLYDKTLELKKNPRDYIPQMWGQAGWNKKQKVWRFEYELKRPALKDFDTKNSKGKAAGINTVRDLNKRLPALWQFLTHEWLRLAEVNQNDTHRERWKVHALWKIIQGAFGDPALAQLERRRFDFGRAPKDAYLFKNGLSSISSMMALADIDDPDEAFETLFLRADQFHKYESHGKFGCNEYLAGKAKEKKKKFNKYIADKKVGGDSDG